MAHIGKSLCLTVSVFISYKSTVLLVFHKEYKTWLPVGGHIEKEEDHETAVYREILEETSLKKGDLAPIIITPLIGSEIFSDMSGRPLLSPLYSDIHSVGPKRQHVGFRFFLKSTKNKVVSQDKDIQKIKWFTLEELNDPKYNLKKHVKFYGINSIKLSGNIY